MKISNNGIKDITVIGGGPTGLSAMFRAGMHETSARLFESLPMLGGQVSALYPEKNIYDVNGIPEIKGSDLIQNLWYQIKSFDQEINLGTTVQRIYKNNKKSNFMVETDKGSYPTNAIIIGGGIGTIAPRELKVRGIDSIKSGIQYAVKKKKSYKNQNVVILGGGDSAVDWALELQSIANSVHIVHRRDEFRAHASTVKKLQYLNHRRKLKIYTPYSPYEIDGNNSVKSLTIKNMSGKITTIPCDVILVMYGFVSNLGPMGNWNIDVEKKRIKVNQRMETSISGFFAAGDVVSYDGKIKLISTGFAEAAIAVKSAIEFIHPGKSVKMKFSSISGKPKGIK